MSGEASNITGYYLLNGMPHHHNSGDTFVDIGENNMFARANIRDKAGNSDFPPPWSAGGYDWIIPNHFKLKSESGDGKKYHDATESLRLVDETGKSTVTKEGASAERNAL